MNRPVFSAGVIFRRKPPLLLRVIDLKYKEEKIMAKVPGRYPSSSSSSSRSSSSRTPSSSRPSTPKPNTPKPNTPKPNTPSTSKPNPFGHNGISPIYGNPAPPAKPPASKPANHTMSPASFKTSSAPVYSNTAKATNIGGMSDEEFKRSSANPNTARIAAEASEAARKAIVERSPSTTSTGSFKPGSVHDNPNTGNAIGITSGSNDEPAHASTLFPKTPQPKPNPGTPPPHASTLFPTTPPPNPDSSPANSIIIKDVTKSSKIASETQTKESGKNYEAYLDKFAWFESRDVKDVVNKFGYMGLWQLGYDELYEAGFVSKDNEFNTDLSKKYGISCQDDFLKSEEAQKAAVKSYEKKLWQYIENYGLDSCIGQTIDGHNITASGLLAAGHFGVGSLNKHIKDGTLSEFKEANGMKAVKYIDELGGYDVSEVTG